MKYAELTLTRPKTRGVSAEVCVITPEVAAAALGRAAPNRKRSPWRVSVLEYAITAGRWLLNGEAIIFDRMMRLLDGQNRLAAVVAANRSILSVVVSGVDSSVFGTIDSGQIRSASQVFTMMQIKYPGVKSAAIRYLLQRQNNLEAERTERAREIVPTWRIQEWYGEHIAEFEKACGAIDIANGQRELQGIFPFSTVLFFYLVIRDSKPKEALQFIEGLISGVDLGAGSPILAVRRWASACDDPTNRDQVAKMRAMLWRAWELWLDGTKVRFVRAPNPEQIAFGKAGFVAPPAAG